MLAGSNSYLTDKALSTIFTPVIANMCNMSFDQWSYYTPTAKEAIVEPEYRPTANLSFLSKTIERLVDAQLVSYAEKNLLLPV